MLLTWHYVTAQQYKDAEVTTKTANKLFFISDTGEIYRGTQLFTESCKMYTGELTEKAVGRIYINETTLEGKIWNGKEYKTVIQPVTSTIIKGDTIRPVTSKAVEDYVTTKAGESVQNAIITVAYDETNNAITTTTNGATENTIELVKTATDITYDKSSGAISLVNAKGETIGVGVNIDVERFVKTATYNAETTEIILGFNDESEPLKINVGDLVDTYTAKNTNTVNMSVTDNAFEAHVKVSALTNNRLTIAEDGLFVADQNISGKVDKPAEAVAGNIAVLATGGNIADIGLKVGESALNANPNTKTLATEAAVAAIRTALQTNIDAKISKVANATAGNVATFTADGAVADSTIKIGGDTLAETPAGDTLATEAGVAAHVQAEATKLIPKTNIVTTNTMAATVAAASDEKVISEKAIVEALTWKTTV